MSERLYDYVEIENLKDMLNKTRNMYSKKTAYKIRIEDNKYRTITHEEVRNMVDCLGTALIDLGLKGKRIAVIGSNRYEWEIAYLSVVCGTGIVVPLDKSLPENELEALIERSEVEAIFYTNKYEETIKKIKYSGKNKLKHLISMDICEHSESIYSQEELITKGKMLIEEGDREFLDSKINSEEMSIMLFTSGTTSASKVVSLSHKNICSNLMDIASILDVNSNDTLLSVLPVHHVFECTVGFLFGLYKGAETVYGKLDGIVHAIAHANTKDLHNDFINTSKEGYAHAVDVSSYSFVLVSRIAKELDMLNENASLITLTYHGSTKVMPGYNIMGVAKAALETSVRYLAENLGRDGIRVNAISAGPIKTLSAKGIKDFSSSLTIVEEKAPLHKNVTTKQVGDVSTFLISDMSNCITGQVIYADNGYNIMGV